MSTDTTSQDVLRGGGEMGALMRSIDWSRTVVGPVSAWPQSLRTALSILLETGFPMYIAWGPAYTQFYNDGYRPILGSTKHPGAMGASTRETFAEIWDIIGPMFAGVMQGTPTTLVDFMLPLDRHGFTEECYFIFSYSPIRQESGTVGGVLVTVTETTQRVLGERRLKTTQALAARTRGATRVDEAFRLSGEVIGQNPADVPFALIYLVEQDGAAARLVSAAGVVTDEAAVAPARLTLDGHSGDPWPIGRAVQSRQAVLVDTSSLGPAGVPGVARALVLPIAQQGESGAIGALVAGLSPRLMLDDAYTDFLAMVASQIGTAVVSARAFEDAEARAQALAELDRAKTAFFSNVSHEFRTPLTLLLGPTEEAAGSPDGVLQGADLQTVHRNAQRLLKLVNALLDFSRIEAGRVQAVFEPTDLAMVTADLASAFRSATERAGLDLIVDCPPLPDRVYLDRDMWEKVVLNLLSNAFKFTFAGSITVSIAWHGRRSRWRCAIPESALRRRTCRACSTASIASSAPTPERRRARGSGWHWCASWWRCMAAASRSPACSGAAPPSRCRCRPAAAISPPTASAWLGRRHPRPPARRLMCRRRCGGCRHRRPPPRRRRPRSRTPIGR